MKLGRNDLLDKPDGMQLSFFYLATRGMRYLRERGKIGRFGYFQGILALQRALTGGQNPPEVAEGLLSTACGGPSRYLPTSGVWD